MQYFDFIYHYLFQKLEFFRRVLKENSEKFVELTYFKLNSFFNLIQS